MSNQHRRVDPVLWGRRVPARSQVTVRRGDSPLGRSATLAALRASRTALSRLEGELGELLTALRAPGGRPDPSAADRVRGATAAADSALAFLSLRSEP